MTDEKGGTGPIDSARLTPSEPKIENNGDWRGPWAQEDLRKYAIPLGGIALLDTNLMIPPDDPENPAYTIAGLKVAGGELPSFMHGAFKEVHSDQATPAVKTDWSKRIFLAHAFAIGHRATRERLMGRSHFNDRENQEWLLNTTMSIMRATPELQEISRKRLEGSLKVKFPD